jgi:hypothetical protein
MRDKRLDVIGPRSKSDAEVRTEAKLVAEITALQAKVAELEGNLRNIRNASLPDPYDERDVSLSWLQKVIDENTK